MWIIATVTAIGILMLLYFLWRSTLKIKKLRETGSALRLQNESLSAKAELMTLAERISNIGTWEFFVATNTVNWSDELFMIYGFKNEHPKISAALNEQIIAPEYREKVKKELQKAILNESTFAVEYQIIQSQGSRRYVLGQGFYIKKEDKLVGTVQDITQQKEAILKLKINETLLREAELVSHSGSWEWVDDSEFVLWSDEMYNIHGFLPHSVFVNFQFYQNLVHPEDLQLFLTNFSTARARKSPFKISYRIVRPSGEIRYVLSTAEYKKIGINTFAYIGNTQDITELRKAQVQLEEKIVELNRSNQDLEQFAYVASHDLQEPLRKIQAFGDKLLSRHLNGLSPEAQDYLRRMISASERMRLLINDLLAFSKLSRARRNFLETNVWELISRTINELDLTVELKQAKIGVQVDLEIECIPSQLEQLFQNLIGNALKFVDPGTNPDIQITGNLKYGYELNIEGTKASQQYAVIEVSDHGIGFEKDEAEKIFDIFYRLHSRSDFSGTGIGLAICKKIADNHSGLIYADSEAGYGTTFTVILPKKQL